MPRETQLPPPRHMGIEVLRILSMAAIVIGHFCNQNNVSGDIIITFLSSGANIAVNLFLLIGAWFMVDKPFNPLRPIKLLLTLLFYGWGLTAIGAIFFQPPCLQFLLQGIFPFFGCALWFATAYIILLIISPYLHQINRLNKIQAVFIGIILPTTIAIISSTPWAVISGGIVAEAFWFICIYLFMHTVKHRTRFFQIAPSKTILIVSILLYTGLILGLIKFLNNEKAYNLLALWRSGIHTLPNFIIAFGIFIGFVKCKRSCPRILQLVSSSTFAIYVIHQMPSFMSHQWSLARKILPFANDTTPHICCNLAIVTLTLFILYPVIDRFRVKYVEPAMIHCRLSNKLYDLLCKLNIPS